MNGIDHFLLGGSSLDDLISGFAKTSGTQATVGGVHKGGGTRNALVGLSNDCYLELIAPDPEQQLEGTWGQQLIEWRKPSLFTFAVRCESINDTVNKMVNAGLERPKILDMSRNQPRGGKLSWRVARFEGHPFGSFLPFVIEWTDGHHPAQSLSHDCTLDAFSISHPEAAQLSEYLNLMGVSIVCSTGIKSLCVKLSTPNGEVALET